MNHYQKMMKFKNIDPRIKYGQKARRLMKMDRRKLQTRVKSNPVIVFSDQELEIIGWK
jgi:hypothetical protein